MQTSNESKVYSIGRLRFGLRSLSIDETDRIEKLFPGVNLRYAKDEPAAKNGRPVNVDLGRHGKGDFRKALGILLKPENFCAKAAVWFYGLTGRIEKLFGRMENAVGFEVLADFFLQTLRNEMNTTRQFDASIKKMIGQ